MNTSSRSANDFAALARNLFFLFVFFLLLPQQVLTYIVVYTYSKIKSHKKTYKIFDVRSRDSTFYKAFVVNANAETSRFHGFKGLFQIGKVHCQSYTRNLNPTD